MKVKAQQKHLEKKIVLFTINSYGNRGYFFETKKLFQFLSRWKTFILSCDEKHKNSMSLGELKVLCLQASISVTSNEFFRCFY